MPPPEVAIVTRGPQEPAISRPPFPEAEPESGSAAEAGEAPASAAADQELRFAQGLIGMPREAQRKVYAQVENLYLQDRTPQNLVRYALLAVVAGAERPAAASRARADLRTYLDPKSGTAGSDPLAPLAVLLLRVLDDREQLTAQYIAQNDLLQKKLDELKAIEQQLLERSESTRPNPPP